MRTVAAGLLAALLAAPAAAQNAAGAPTVSGLWVVGEALTASTGGITDPEGVSSAAFAHQWVRVAADGTETDIAGATSSTYTLAAADEGGRVKVAVSFDDDAGNPEERASAAYPASGSVLPEPCGLDHPHTTLGTELWKATMIVGQSPFPEQFGYARGALSFGELNPANFLHEGASHSISSLYRTGGTTAMLLPDPQGEDFLRLTTDPHIAETDVIKLTMQVCDRFDALYSVHSRANGYDLWNAAVDGKFALPTLRLRLYLDNEAPEVVTAVAAGTRITITFSEPLAPEAVLPATRFQLEVGGVTRKLADTPAAIEGNQLALTLSAPIATSERVTLSYDDGTPLGTILLVALTDPSANVLSTFSNERVVVVPALVSQVLAADGTTLTLTFDEDLDPASVPPAGAFTVRVGGARRALAPVNPVAVAGRAVVLRLASPAGAGERVTVAYAKPAPQPDSPP